MDKIFLVVMFSAVVFCQPTYGAMWRADEENTVRVDLRECEAAAEDGLKVGSERIGNRNRFVFGEERSTSRNYEVKYFLYKEKRSLGPKDKFKKWGPGALNQEL